MTVRRASPPKRAPRPVRAARRSGSADLESAFADSSHEAKVGGSGLGRGSSERDGQVTPLLLGWPAAELAFDTGEDLGELAVVERPDQDQARMRSLRFSPLASDRCEVATVARDQHTPFGCRQLEHLWVGEPLVRCVFGER
jgi:hypothetical protein